MNFCFIDAVPIVIKTNFQTERFEINCLKLTQTVSKVASQVGIQVKKHVSDMFHNTRFSRPEQSKWGRKCTKPSALVTLISLVFYYV